MGISGQPMDTARHDTKLEKCVFVINSNDMVLWIHLFWLGPVLFHFMKLIEFLVCFSKWTNELIKNWQIGLYSAEENVVGVWWIMHPVSPWTCVMSGKCTCDFIKMYMRAQACLKTLQAKISWLTATLEEIFNRKTVFCFIQKPKILSKALHAHH